MIGLAVFGPQLADSLRNLLYIIPVVGVMAYLWLQQQGIVKDGKEQGIDVKTGIVTGSAQVIGIEGAKPGADLPKKVQVSTILASDKAKVIGTSYAYAEPEVPRNRDLEDLTVIFKQLERSNQIKLLNSAESLLKKQENTHA